MMKPWFTRRLCLSIPEREAAATKLKLIVTVVIINLQFEASLIILYYYIIIIKNKRCSFGIKGKQMYYTMFKPL